MRSNTSLYEEHKNYTYLWEYVFFIENNEQCSDEEYVRLKREADAAYWRYNEFKIDEMNRQLFHDFERIKRN